jgi:hypothetical protein
MDFWLIDNQRGEGTILPEPGDLMVRVGSLQATGGVAKLDADFSDQQPEGFEPDFIAITEAGNSPVESRLLTAQTTLYQRLYLSQKRGTFGALGDDEPTPNPVAKKAY